MFVATAAGTTEQHAEAVEPGVETASLAVYRAQLLCIFRRVTVSVLRTPSLKVNVFWGFFGVSFSGCRRHLSLF